MALSILDRGTNDLALSSIDALIVSLCILVGALAARRIAESKLVGGKHQSQGLFVEI
jgi:hypothetical protein